MADNNDSLLPEPQELRIVLIGRVGAGKTAVMKTILSGAGENEKPPSEFKILSDTECQKENVKIGSQNVVIVDTPGLCHADKTDEEVVDKIKEGLSLVAPGPHVFLFVLDLDRFTQQENVMVDLIWKTFGSEAEKYSMVLFTHGNDLSSNGKTIDDFIKESDKLEKFVKKCKGEYHVIDNENQDPSEVAELLKKIRDMVEKNGGNCYSLYRIKLKRIALKGSALAGAGVGAATTYYVGSEAGIKQGAAAGAAVGGVMACVGIVGVQQIARKCVIQ